jgi:hypothetical protein
MEILYTYFHKNIEGFKRCIYTFFEDAFRPSGKVGLKVNYVPRNCSVSITSFSKICETLTNKVHLARKRP